MGRIYTYRQAGRRGLVVPFFLIIMGTTTGVIHGQTPPRDLFQVAFENTFEGDRTGDYQYADYTSGWNNPNGNNRYGLQDIINENDGSHNTFMRGYFQQGTLGPDQGGWSWNTAINGQQTELYFSYDIRFKPGFEWVLGGKIPGMTGGTVISGTVPQHDHGFSARMMWKENGKLAFYVYHHDQSIIYGNTYYWGDFQFTSGKWYNITIRLVLNSVENSSGLNNGILEGFVDGKLRVQLNNFKFRNLESISIDNLYICSFFGGNTPDWNTARDEWIDTDNYIVYKYQDQLVSVPHGRELSSWDKLLLHPYYNFEDAGWKSSFQTIAVSHNMVSVKWDHYPIPAQYKLERQDYAGGPFSEIASLPYGSTNYTDYNVAFNTDYIYRISAAGSLSNNLPVHTPVLTIPASPTSLGFSSLTANSVKLNWIDNADNEQGYKIYRSVSAAGPFTETGDVGPNTSSVTDNTISENNSYYYRVCAYNDAGNSGYSNIIQVSYSNISPPAAPSQLTANEVMSSGLLLSWKDNSNDENGFKLYRSTSQSDGYMELATLGVNEVSYTDKSVSSYSTYYYKVRGFNNAGFSAYSNTSQVNIKNLAAPIAPTQLKSTDVSDKSITFCWKDNSQNESGFLITRSLAADPAVSVNLRTASNATTFTDSTVSSGTTYLYSVKAFNEIGASSSSNRYAAAALSVAEKKRCKDGLIAYYNFGYNPDFIIYDLSGYEDPLNLTARNKTAVAWDEENHFDIVSNTAIVSVGPATKIVNAVKKSNAFSVECWVKPLEPEFSDGARVISLAGSNEKIGFVLDQDYNETVEDQSIGYRVRVQTASTNSAGYPEYVPEKRLQTVNLQHLVYTRDSLGIECMYINGEKSLENFRPSDFSSWENSFYLTFGNEADMDHPWKGSYYSVAIFNKALTEKQIAGNYAVGPRDSLQNEGVEFLVSVFPNPVNDIARIELIPLKSQDVVPQTLIRVLDVYGKVHYQEYIFNPNTMISRELDLSTLTPGFYFMQVISGNRQQSTKLIVQ